MYDYYLGGHDNFAADRIAALKVIEAAPDVPAIARANRRFLGRAVRFLAAEAGISQFLDLGTGLPAQGNVHQIAQQANPAARVVYADNDPMVLAHSRALKTGTGTAVIHADLRDPGAVLGHPGTCRLIDFREPVAILLIAVLHFVADPDAGTAAARYAGAASPGSYLVISHVTAAPEPQSAQAVTAVYAGTANPGTLRTREQILALFAGTALVEPGLVPVTHWRPDQPEQAGQAKDWMLAAVARKPGQQAIADNS
jgi:S-adenosyl methyltransferase